MVTMLAELDHPAYHAAVRLPLYNGPVRFSQTISDRDAFKVLAIANPLWSKSDHLALARQHQSAGARQRASYDSLLAEAARETFGRPLGTFDFKISTIVSEAFTDEKKAALRFTARSATAHKLAASAHAYAARKKPRRTAAT